MARGETVVVVPDANAVPEHDAASNQLIAYEVVPPLGWAVSVDEPPLSITVFDSVIGFASNALSTVIVLLIELKTNPVWSMPTALKVCDPCAGMFEPKVMRPVDEAVIVFTTVPVLIRLIVYGPVPPANIVLKVTDCPRSSIVLLARGSESVGAVFTVTVLDALHCTSGVVVPVSIALYE